MDNIIIPENIKVISSNDFLIRINNYKLNNSVHTDIAILLEHYTDTFHLVTPIYSKLIYFIKIDNLIFRVTAVFNTVYIEVYSLEDSTMFDVASLYTSLDFFHFITNTIYKSRYKSRNKKTTE